MASMVRRAVDELGVEASVVKVEAIDQILALGVLSTPALVVNGAIKIRGRLATIAEIKTWIQEVNV
jgi:protein-disulfide isomerase